MKVMISHLLSYLFFSFHAGILTPVKSMIYTVISSGLLKLLFLMIALAAIDHLLLFITFISIV